MAPAWQMGQSLAIAPAHRGGDQGVAALSSQPFTIVVPAYNEEAGIAETIERIRTGLDGSGRDYEILVVNDGSTDRTGEVIASLEGSTCVEHPHNRGYGAALKTGIEAARHDLIVITDADGSYPVDQIPKLVDLCQDVDMVVGARTGQNVQYSKLRSIPKVFLVRFAEWITRRKIPDLNSGLRVFRRDVARRFSGILSDGFSFTTTITLAMLTNGYRVVYTPIDYYARTGKSKIRPIRDTLRFVNLILKAGVYFAPLRVFGPIAWLLFIGFLISAGYDVFVRSDLRETTLLLFLAAMQFGAFAFLADMIVVRTMR